MQVFNYKPIEVNMNLHRSAYDLNPNLPFKKSSILKYIIGVRKTKNVMALFEKEISE